MESCWLFSCRQLDSEGTCLAKVSTGCSSPPQCESEARSWNLGSLRQPHANWCLRCARMSWTPSISLKQWGTWLSTLMSHWSVLMCPHSSPMYPLEKRLRTPLSPDRIPELLDLWDQPTSAMGVNFMNKKKVLPWAPLSLWLLPTYTWNCLRSWLLSQHPLDPVCGSGMWMTHAASFKDKWRGWAPR